MTNKSGVVGTTNIQTVTDNIVDKGAYYSIPKDGGSGVPSVISMMTIFNYDDLPSFLPSDVNFQFKFDPASIILLPSTPITYTTPTPPSSVTAAPATSCGKVALSWALPKDANNYGETYNVRYSLNGTKGDGPGWSILSTGISDVTYTTPLLNPYKYYFEVTSVNPKGESAPSTIVSAVPVQCKAPVAPTNQAVKTSAACGGKVDISWNTTGTNAETYNVYKIDSTGYNVTKIASGLSATTTKYTDTNTGDTAYYYVTSVNPLGESNYPTPIKALTQCKAPVAPTNQTVKTSATCGGKVDISWNTTGTNANTYNVYKAINLQSIPVKIASELSATTTKYTDTLTGDNIYYSVTSVNILGESGFSKSPISAPASMKSSVCSVAPIPTAISYTIKYSANIGCHRCSKYRL